MKKAVFVILLLLCAAIAAGCTGTEQQPAQEQTTGAVTTVVNTFVPATTKPPATPISQAQASVSDNTVRISDFTFTPQTITVKTGSIVRWENLEADPNYVHRIVFSDATGYTIKYDSSVLSPGQSWSQKFTDPGTYPYFCKIHPQMTGIVIVE